MVRDSFIKLRLCQPQSGLFFLQEIYFLQNFLPQNVTASAIGMMMDDGADRRNNKIATT